MIKRYKDFKQIVSALGREDLTRQLYVATSEAEAERERAEKAEELLKIILPYVPKTVRDTYDIDSFYPESVNNNKS